MFLKNMTKSSNMTTKLMGPEYVRPIANSSLGCWDLSPKCHNQVFNPYMPILSFQDS